jgi:hypothetical protein
MKRIIIVVGLVISIFLFSDKAYADGVTIDSYKVNVIIDENNKKIYFEEYINTLDINGELFYKDIDPTNYNIDTNVDNYVINNSSVSFNMDSNKEYYFKYSDNLSNKHYFELIKSNISKIKCNKFELFITTKNESDLTPINAEYKLDLFQDITPKLMKIYTDEPFDYEDETITLQFDSNTDSSSSTDYLNFFKSNFLNIICCLLIIIFFIVKMISKKEEAKVTNEEKIESYNYKLLEKWFRKNTNPSPILMTILLISYGILFMIIFYCGFRFELGADSNNYTISMILFIFKIGLIFVLIPAIILESLKMHSIIIRNAIVKGNLYYLNNYFLTANGLSNGMVKYEILVDYKDESGKQVKYSIGKKTGTKLEIDNKKVFLLVYNKKHYIDFIL